MQPSILIYARYDAGYGKGHISRSRTLFEFIQNKNPNTHFFSNEGTKTIENLFMDPINHYDIIVFDAAVYDEHELLTLRKHTKKLIVLDYFGTNTSIDLVINLFEREIISPHANFQHFTGIEYALIKDNILQSRQYKRYNSKSPIKILISIGGEDKKQLAKKILSKIIKNPRLFDVTIISPHIHPLQRKGLRVISHTTDMGSYIGQTDIVICNAGTTLLEVLCIGKPAIVVAQNDHEKKFMHSIRKKIPLYSMTLLDHAPRKLNHLKSYIKRRYQYYLDGEGKKRIYKLCSM